MPLLDDVYLLQRQGKAELDPFTYTALFQPLAANATTPVNTSVQADSDFVIRYVQLTAFDVGGNFVPVPNVTMSLFDSGSGRNFQDQPVHVGNWAGGRDNGGAAPFVWPEPKLISGSSVIVTTLTNRTAVALTIDVAFVGFKVFYFPGRRAVQMGA